MSIQTKNDLPDDRSSLPGRSMVVATMVICVLSFLVWLRHFSTMGACVDDNGFFGVMTMIIAVPTGVKVFNCLFKVYGGRVQNARRQNRRRPYWGERACAEERRWRGAYRNEAY